MEINFSKNKIEIDLIKFILYLIICFVFIRNYYFFEV